MLTLTVLISLATPIEKAMLYFYIIVIIFSVLTIASIVGITTFLIGTGFNPEPQYYDPNKQPPWQPLDKKYCPQSQFSIMTLAGVIMLSIYLIPFILRPLDFLANIKSYVVGMISYFAILPLFINIMQIYSMCNLHDISWGNRPSAT